MTILEKIIEWLYKFMNTNQIWALFDLAFYILFFGVMYFFYAFTEFLK